LDFAFFSYTLLVNPGNLDGLDYDHSLARNVCTHMHLCVNGTPMVEMYTTDVKPLICSVTCPSCNVTNAKNDTNETAEEPSLTVLHGVLASQFTVTVEKETMAKPDATADATDFKYATVFSVILFVFVGMTMETFRAGMEMIVPTPAPSRIASRPGSKSTSGTTTPNRTARPGSKSTSGTTTPNGTARNSGPKVDLSAGVWARLAAVAE
jgi:hypothetical protein